MFLETERLVLRKFREEDFADFCEYAIDAEMCRMMGREDIRDEKSARHTFDWLKNREERCYALVYKETGKVIGNLTVGRVPEYLADLEELQGKIGKTLSFSISRRYRRMGLIYESVSAVIDQLFNSEGVEYINCGYFDFNTPSRKLQEKLGFQYLTTIRFSKDGEDFVGIENILWGKQ